MARGQHRRGFTAKPCEKPGMNIGTANRTLHQVPPFERVWVSQGGAVWAVGSTGGGWLCGHDRGPGSVGRVGAPTWPSGSLVPTQEFSKRLPCPPATNTTAVPTLNRSRKVRKIRRGQFSVSRSLVRSSSAIDGAWGQIIEGWAVYTQRENQSQGCPLVCHGRRVRAKDARSTSTGSHARAVFEGCLRPLLTLLGTCLDTFGQRRGGQDDGNPRRRPHARCGAPTGPFKTSNKHVLQELIGRLYLPMSQKSAH
eukprot:735533-Pyramimonas_sp.AAC.2